MRGVETGTFADNPPPLSALAGQSQPLPPTAMRTGMRMAEQLVSNTLYGAL